MGEPSSGAAVPLSWLSPVTVVVGHYGVGKTNLAVNLAVDAADAGAEVVLVDLDIVNPYFRSSDYADLLERHGVRVIAPVLAGTTLDSPSLSGRVTTAVEWAQQGAVAGDATVAGETRAKDDAPTQPEGALAASAVQLPCCITIIDAGGDDVGATALGRFAPAIAREPYAMLYVVNRYRNLTQQPQDALEVLRQIEAKAGLRATAVANNSHLKQETRVETVAQALGFGREAAALAGLPLAFATVPKSLAGGENQAVFPAGEHGNLYPVSVFVKTPWE